MTTEEKARAYVGELRVCKAIPGAMIPMIADMVEAAYLDGATEALASQWKDPKVELPEDGECVLISTGGFVEPALWNEHHQYWDNAAGDGSMYSKECVKAWMYPPPLKGGEKCQ